MSSPDICHACGAETIGSFCHECGARVRVICKACETPAAATAKFCHECGTALSAPADDRKDFDRVSESAHRTVGPWFYVGAAGLVLAIAGGAILLNRQNDDASRAGTASTSVPTGGTGAASVDLSSMTPREAADRLYNRVMSASESGDMSEARTFVPMALQAYELLGPPGIDEHYHLALLRLVAEDTASAQSHVDAIRQASPNHLFGFMLAHAIAEKQSDASAGLEAFHGFLSAYGSEIELRRREYSEHSLGIERFRERAQKATGSGSDSGAVP